MHLSTLKAKKCHRAFQDDTESPLVSNNPLKILSQRRIARIVTGQQAERSPWESSCDKASTESGLHEEAPILDDNTSYEVDTAPNMRRRYYKDKRMCRCAVLPDHIAVWYLKETRVALSALAATVLISEGLIKVEALQMCWKRDYLLAHQPTDPLSGGTMALVGSVIGVAKGIVELPIGIVKSFGRKSASRAEEDRREDCVPGLPNQAQEISLPKSLDVLPNRPDNCSTSQEAAQCSARARDNAHDLTSPILDKEISLFDVQEDLGNATMNKNHPSEPQEHSSTVSRSLLSTSSSNSLTLATVQGLGRIVGTTCAAPLAFTLGMTQGFRNAPALYGDTTVRPVTDVTGWRSGIKTACKEFGFGMYDGLSGILTQPYHGAKKEGSLGLVKGVGKGLAGVIAKPGAAVFALPAYTLEGIFTEVHKQRSNTTGGSRSVDTSLHDALLEQGRRESAGLGVKERLSIVQTWMEMEAEDKHKVVF